MGDLQSWELQKSVLTLLTSLINAHFWAIAQNQSIITLAINVIITVVIIFFLLSYFFMRVTFLLATFK